MIKKIKFILSKILFKTITYLRSNYKYAFLFPFIIDKIIDVPAIKDSNDPVLNYVISIATLQVLILISFISIIMNVLALYLLSNDNLTKLNVIKVKYPKFIIIINYFAKASKWTIIFETIVVILGQVFIIGLNYFVAL